MFIPLPLILNLSSIVLFTLNVLMLSWLFLIFKSFFQKTEQSKRDLPKVSILVPTYNQAKEISVCLKSINKLNYPKEKIETIVIDDGSTDSTWEIIKMFHHIKSFKQEHKGKFHALNFGLMKCKGDFILVLDADTTLEKNSLRNAVQRLSDKVGAITFVPKISNRKNFLAWFQNVEYHFNSLIRKGLNCLRQGGIYVWGCATLYNAKILKKIKFPGSLTEDLDLSIEMQKSGYKILLSENSFAYTKVPSNLMKLLRQRIRWNLGGLHAIEKNRKLLFNYKYRELGAYLLPSHFYWYPFVFLIVPLIILQILYWLPYQLESIPKIFWYFFTWFSFAGPLYTIYMIPHWGFSLPTLLGILPAFITTFTSLLSLKFFKEKIDAKNLFATFFLFPYFFFLNFSTILAVFIFLTRSKHVW